MRRLFFIASAVVFFAVATMSWFWPPVLFSLVILLPLFAVGLQHAFQKKRAILRNFPLLGMFRYGLEKIRPEIQQYFIESETDGAPVAREIRSLVYQRAKLQTDTLPFGTQRDVYTEGYEWLAHSLAPKHIDPHSLRIKIGGPDCKQPYSASVFNISAMSYGALSPTAVQSLNGGAQLGGFYHNTGEGGISPHHLSGGGDLVWQIGTGYFGCRTSTGDFSPQLFKEASAHPQVKMIEIKLSQGAKPSHGGILPAAKITPEIIAIRKVEPGKDVVSPPAHRKFNDPKGLLAFVRELRQLSDGKPVGFKLCVGQYSEFMAICKAMIETKILPDFITVDGGEGGTGAAPLEFSNSVGAPLEEGLSFVHDTLCGFGLRDSIRIIASGKVMTGFNLFSRIALGADLCNSARGMMLALGCIQARQCNTNHCPAGVATNNANLYRGLVPSDKKVRVFNYHRNTVHAFADLLGAAGLESPDAIQRSHVSRRVSRDVVKTYEQLFPGIRTGSFHRGDVPVKYREAFDRSNPQSFTPRML
ncbi:MAG TPA: FMN-binding glutamate synthase family protein, partial [Bdellovibrionales bacterium]|nr:FMN-binding glutamate synthase family protein [Bdellovibrionales bacterium]